MKGTISKKIFLITIIFGVMISTALAIPAGPMNLTEIGDQRLVDFTYQTNNAIAGNVTELIFDTWSVTRTWQGYYGNITGTIVLANQANQTLYDWANTNPNGRIYATRKSSPTWSNVRCANRSELDVYEAEFSGTNASDRNGIYAVDRPNATFVNSSINGTGFDGNGNNGFSGMYANYSTFWVGPVQINGTYTGSECFSAVMHNSTGWVNQNQNAGNNINKWREVLLSDGTGMNGTIYTSILETNDAIGFDARPHDFQMIVPENGHGTDELTTTYYFFVELE